MPCGFVKCYAGSITFKCLVTDPIVIVIYELVAAEGKAVQPWGRAAWPVAEWAVWSRMWLVVKSFWWGTGDNFQRSEPCSVWFLDETTGVSHWTMTKITQTSVWTECRIALFLHYGFGGVNNVFGEACDDSALPRSTGWKPRAFMLLG